MSFFSKVSKEKTTVVEPNIAPPKSTATPNADYKYASLPTAASTATAAKWDGKHETYPHSIGHIGRVSEMNQTNPKFITETIQRIRDDKLDGETVSRLDAKYYAPLSKTSIVMTQTVADTKRTKIELSGSVLKGSVASKVYPHLLSQFCNVGETTENNRRLDSTLWILPESITLRNIQTEDSGHHHPTFNAAVIVQYPPSILERLPFPDQNWATFKEMQSIAQAYSSAIGRVESKTSNTQQPITIATLYDVSRGQTTVPQILHKRFLLGRNETAKVVLTLSRSLKSSSVSMDELFPTISTRVCSTDNHHTYGTEIYGSDLLSGIPDKLICRYYLSMAMDWEHLLGELICDNVQRVQRLKDEQRRQQQQQYTNGTTEKPKTTTEPIDMDREIQRVLVQCPTNPNLLSKEEDLFLNYFLPLYRQYVQKEKEKQKQQQTTTITTTVVAVTAPPSVVVDNKLTEIPEPNDGYEILELDLSLFVKFMREFTYLFSFRRNCIPVSYPGGIPSMILEFDDAIQKSFDVVIKATPIHPNWFHIEEEEKPDH